MFQDGLNKCWVCYELESYKNPNIKQICTPIRIGRGKLMSGIVVWLCGKCKINYKRSE